VEEHQTLKDVNALVTKIIDHENVCTQAIIDDLIEQIDQEFVDKEYIKVRLHHVSDIINKTFGC
jgi:RNA-binding protein YhbY